MATIESTNQLAPAGTWSADPVHSNVSFEVVYAGVNTFRGSFDDFSATLAGRRARRGGQGRFRRHQGRAAERPPPDAGLLRLRALPGDHVQGDRPAPPRRTTASRARASSRSRARPSRSSSPASSPPHRRPTRSAASASASGSRPRSTARSTASAGTCRTRAVATTSRTT